MAVPKTAAEPTPNPLDAARAQLEAASERLNLDGGLRRVLATCKRERVTNFPVQMDDGSASGSPLGRDRGPRCAGPGSR